ncbi:hypothetical protein [Arthrobacter zhaoguopingii]|uniref:hypothetical protein n=1 Tax=Arthrobacter zhaoguopingii TaxID=2681491 RepID=UPI0013576D6B|nr:hypothetical protein [Arthrobacter zhaoguopingii]
MHNLLPNSAKTGEAEMGLGIRPSAYFYLGRCDPDYGDQVVGYERPSTDESLVSPFDTGGLWHGHVVTTPPLAQSTLKTFVARHSHGVPAFALAFQQWGNAEYNGSSKDYTAGQQPVKAAVPNIDLSSPRAEPRWWTWEGRIAHGSTAMHTLQPVKVFMTQDDFESYEPWVRDDVFLPTHEKKRHLSHLRAILVPTGNEDPAQAMNLWLEGQTQW